MVCSIRTAEACGLVSTLRAMRLVDDDGLHVPIGCFIAVYVGVIVLCE